MSLLDVLLGGIGPEKKTFNRTSSPSPPSSPSGLGTGEAGGDGEDVRRKVSASIPSDPYAERAQAALREINRPDYPAGMIPWLGEAHPELYDELTSRIPDEINLAWKCQAPLAEFEAVLAGLVETHRRACELYKEHLQKHADRVLERRPEAKQAK